MKVHVLSTVVAGERRADPLYAASSASSTKQKIDGSAGRALLS
jgi:hypothetical protein